MSSNIGDGSFDVDGKEGAISCRRCRTSEAEIDREGTGLDVNLVQDSQNAKSKNFQPYPVFTKIRCISLERRNAKSKQGFG